MSKTHPAINIHLPMLTDHLDGLRVRTATADDAVYVQDRSYQWRKRVGWLPTGAIDDAIARDQVWLVTLQGWEAGHLLISGGTKTQHCLRHNCVEQDLWNKGIGELLTNVYIAYSYTVSPHTTCRVRTRRDLIAQSKINIACGGLITAIDPPAKTSKHPVVSWDFHLRQRPRRVRVMQEAPVDTILDLIHDPILDIKALNRWIATKGRGEGNQRKTTPAASRQLEKAAPG